MPCILATKRKPHSRAVSHCNKVVSGDDAHFDTLRQALDSGEPVCKRCLRVAKGKQNKAREAARKRPKAPVKKNAKELIAEPKKAVVQPKGIPQKTTEWDLDTVFKIRRLALLIAMDTEPRADNDR